MQLIVLRLDINVKKNYIKMSIAVNKSLYALAKYKKKWHCSKEVQFPYNTLYYLTALLVFFLLMNNLFALSMNTWCITICTHIYKRIAFALILIPALPLLWFNTQTKWFYV